MGEIFSRELYYVCSSVIFLNIQYNNSSVVVVLVVMKTVFFPTCVPWRPWAAVGQCVNDRVVRGQLHLDCLRDSRHLAPLLGNDPRTSNVTSDPRPRRRPQQLQL